MAKFKQNKKPSEQTVAEAQQLAKANQKPGQSKEQTKLIALGIQKGIEQYKKQYKIKSRALDKKLKQHQQKGSEEQASSASPAADNFVVKLPWILLILSWLGFVAYRFLFLS